MAFIAYNFIESTILFSFPAQRCLQQDHVSMHVDVCQVQKQNQTDVHANC